MTLTTMSAGAYPRVGDAPGQQKLRKAIEARQKGDLGDAEFKAIENDAVAQAVAEQASAGVDVVTDGLLRWYDPVSHVMAKLGAEVGGLLRWYDTNTYFRQSTLNALPRRNGDLVVGEFTFAKGLTTKPVKPVLTGPYTLARLSLTTGPAWPALCERLASILADEVAALAAAGATWIQVDEPEILRHPEDFAVLTSAMKTIAAKKGGARLLVQTYFGNATPHVEKLLALPADAVGFDLSYSPGIVDALKSRTGAVALGCVDARNTRLEDADAVAKTLKPLAGRDLILSPTTSLEYLPRDRAREKLALLPKIKKALS